MTAGLGIFLLGMSFLEHALSELGGVRLRSFLKRHTKNPLKAVVGGTVATAILQSSSVISLLVLAFVGAQMIELRNALAIIMGANLGTTFTGWIVAFFGFSVKIESFSYPLIAIGLVAMALLRSHGKLPHYAKLVAGFGLLFFGLGFMKEAMDGFAQNFDLSGFKNYGIVVFFLVGVVFTAIIQSSSATMALTLSALNMQIVTLDSAAALVIGADLGTTITVILGAVGGTVAKKRVALFHLLFNLLVDLAALLSLPILIAFVQWVISSENPLFILVGFHNLFNIAGIVVFLPFVAQIANWLEQRFTKPEISPARFISKVTPTVEEAASEALDKEVRRLVAMVAHLSRQWTHLENRVADFDPEGLQERLYRPNGLKDRYNYIKRLEGEILHYMASMRQTKSSPEIEPYLAACTGAVRDAVRSVKAIKNVRHDVEYFEGSLQEAEQSLFNGIISALKEFYSEFDDIWNSPDQDAKFEELIELNELVELQYREQMEAIYATVGKTRLGKEEISTLLNVIRQLHTSNSALLGATKAVFLSDEQIQIMDNLRPVSA